MSKNSWLQSVYYSFISFFSGQSIAKIFNNHTKDTISQLGMVMYAL